MRLIEEWRQAWRWFSCQAMALAAAVQGAWVAVPDDMKAHMPGWIATASTIALLLAGIGGRLVQQTRKGA
jgi:hypothetical protein